MEEEALGHRDREQISRSAVANNGSHNEQASRQGFVELNRQSAILTPILGRVKDTIQQV